VLAAKGDGGRDLRIRILGWGCSALRCTAMEQKFFLDPRAYSDF
jgi:hypothetical protein